jgi:hypothetical protein
MQHRSLLTWLTLVAAAGCASAPPYYEPDDDAAAPGAPDVAVDPGAPIVIEPAAATPVCADGQYYLGRVTGVVYDESNRPLSGGLLSICGTTCISGETGRDGRFEVTVNTCFAGSSEYAHGVAFTFDGLNQRPDIFFDFNPTNARRMGVVRINRPFYVGTYRGAGFAAAPMRSSAAMTIADGLGFSLRFVPSTIEYPITASEEAVRVVRVPVARLAPYLGRAPAAMYAISPSDSVLSAPAAVEFPNVSGLRPNTVVDIVAVGNHASAGRPPVGVLERIDTGRVSADGRRIVSTTGLRFFGTVGYRTVSP